MHIKYQMLIPIMSISLWKFFHLGTTITRDHKHLCQCKSIFLYSRKPSTLGYKNLFLKLQITFGYIRPHSRITTLSRGKKLKLLLQVLLQTVLLIKLLDSHLVYKILDWLRDLQACFRYWSSSQDGASTPGVFNLIWNSLSVCSSWFWFPEKYAAMALWNRTSWLCNTLTCRQG